MTFPELSPIGGHRSSYLHGLVWFLSIIPTYLSVLNIVEVEKLIKYHLLAIHAILTYCLLFMIYIFLLVIKK